MRIPDVPEQMQIPDVPELMRIPDVPEQMQIPDVPEQMQMPDVPELMQIPDVPEPPVQNPDVPQTLVQIPDVPQPLVQIPDVKQPPVQIPPELDTSELDPLEPTDTLDQLMSFVFGPPAQALQLLHTVPSIFDGDLISFLDEFERESRLKVLSSGSLPVSPSLGGVSASKYGGLLFGSHAQHATGGRVRDLVDVLGPLGNASRRKPTLAYGVAPTLETGFGNTCGTLASEIFGPWDAL
ncbi:hypothetical protein TNCV_4042821 [Trichonephila clavipes]|nr:hypothetical protein TNCV_4042821 [Trichonephila clavipes]